MTKKGEGFMDILNLTVNRIIIHQIYRRNEDGTKVSPIQSHEYTRFAPDAMEEFKKRVKDALGEGSKAVEMQIEQKSSGSIPAIVDKIIDKTDDEFAVSSFDFAERLTDVQQSRGIPGGILVVFDGTYGANQNKYLGIIKAEIHSGYEKQIDKNEEITLKFVEEILLTPGTRLYKTAGFFKVSDDDEDLTKKWLVKVSDYQISKAEGKASAKYFYADFLGCGYPETSARTTRHFYEATSKFIGDLNLGASEKNDLFNALTTYLKAEKSSTASASDFAEKYFDVDTQDYFLEYLDESGAPKETFTKDIEHIQSKLKYRRVNFGGNVKLTAPSEVFRDKVIIETIEGDASKSGSPEQWTRVTIKDRVVNQE